MTAREWLPPGKQAAVCFSIDDVHATDAAGHQSAGATSHQVFDRLAGPAAGTRVAYNRREWHGQFLARPGTLLAVEGVGAWKALIERAPQFDRVLAISVLPPASAGTVCPANWSFHNGDRM